MNQRVKKLAKQAVQELYNDAVQFDHYTEVITEDLWDLYMRGYYQACSDNAVTMATKNKSRVRLWLRAVKGLFVKLDDDAQYNFNERRWH
jgi:hypothetical protein